MSPSRFRPLTAGRWPDLELLFGVKGELGLFSVGRLAVSWFTCP